MCIWQWIQTNESFLLFLATLILAFITFLYMLSTRKMAKSMEIQTAIMAENYERNIAPICRAHFVSNSTNNEETKIRFMILNYGKEIFYVIKIIIKIWSIDNPQAILQQHEQEENIIALPMYEFPEARINIRLNPEVARFFPDRDKKIKWETTFFVKDVRNREHEFHTGMRSLF